MIFTISPNKDMFAESNKQLKESVIKKNNTEYIKYFFCSENVEYLKKLINKYLQHNYNICPKKFNTIALSNDMIDFFDLHGNILNNGCKFKDIN